MFFIGVVSDSRRYNDLLYILQKNKNINDICVFNINNKNINNLKNIKFDLIIIEESLTKINESNTVFYNLCKKVKYLLINSDINIGSKILGNIEANIITFGLNHKSTITFSSITDEKVLISVQRSFANINDKDIEFGEYKIEITPEERTYLHELMINFAINKLLF